MNSEKALISIIIPTFNRVIQLEETLKSIISQTYTNWECLVVDDGSTDNTSVIMNKLLKQDTRFQYYQRPETHLKGGNGARNYGFINSKGDYIQWFDSDDIMYPNFLEAQFQNLVKNKAVFSLCLYDLYSENTGEVSKGYPQTLKDSFYLDYITRRLSANLPTMFFKKSALEGISLNEHLLKSQEYEFLQRFFRLHQHEGVLLNKSLLKVIRHKDSITEQHSPDKIASALDALLITYSELPKDCPVYIRKELILLYLKTLYLAFTNRMTVVYYKYLLKIPSFQIFKKFIVICYLGMLYGTVKVLPIGNWHYKYIYNLYH
ncbi:hypothetical protein DI383_02230 [Flavobacteriaceae bacterium LYZ1037]|nr:hypothetical protein DI383_02230 [Flavobacteriaceae bacterium LYZ1037]